MQRKVVVVEREKQTKMSTRTYRIGAPAGATNIPVTQTKTTQTVYTGNTNQVQRPIEQRQLTMYQVQNAGLATAKANYNFFTTGPANPPLDGDGYRTPYIKKNMEILGIGLDINPKLLVDADLSAIAAINIFGTGSSTIVVGSRRLPSFNNSSIGPKFVELDQGSGSGKYDFTIVQREPVTFREAQSGNVNNETVKSLDDVSVEVKFNAPYGFTYKGIDSTLTCTLLVRTLEEVFIS